MSAWDEVLAHRLTDPDPGGLAAMAGALGREVRVSGIERLAGGVATAVHVVALTDGVLQREVVLKRFPPGIGSPENEWDAIGFAHAAGLASPKPVLYDSGSWFGAPAIVMSLLPGSLLLHPTDLEQWAAALVDALAGIHAVSVEAAPASLRRSAIWDRWDDSGLVPSPRTDAIGVAIAELRARTWPRSFCHCDFHPGNVLFRDGVVAGVVDWSSAKIAPVLSDLGRLRAAVAIWPGGDTPDLVAAAYTERTGCSQDGLAYWDVFSGAVTLENSANWLPLYETLDVSLDAREVAARATAFIDQALSGLDRG